MCLSAITSKICSLGQYINAQCCCHVFRDGKSLVQKVRKKNPSRFLQHPMQWPSDFTPIYVPNFSESGGWPKIAGWITSTCNFPPLHFCNSRPMLLPSMAALHWFKNASQWWFLMESYHPVQCSIKAPSPGFLLLERCRKSIQTNPTCTIVIFSLFSRLFYFYWIVSSSICGEGETVHLVDIPCHCSA